MPAPEWARSISRVPVERRRLSDGGDGVQENVVGTSVLTRGSPVIVEQSGPIESGASPFDPALQPILLEARTAPEHGRHSPQRLDAVGGSGMQGGTPNDLEDMGAAGPVVAKL